MVAVCSVNLEASEASVLTQFTTFPLSVCMMQSKSLYKHISHSTGGGTLVVLVVAVGCDNRSNVFGEVVSVSQTVCPLWLEVCVDCVDLLER